MLFLLLLRLPAPHGPLFVDLDSGFAFWASLPGSRSERLVVGIRGCDLGAGAGGNIRPDLFVLNYCNFSLSINAG